MWRGRKESTTCGQKRKRPVIVLIKLENPRAEPPREVREPGYERRQVIVADRKRHFIEAGDDDYDGERSSPSFIQRDREPRRGGGLFGLFSFGD